MIQPTRKNILLAAGLLLILWLGWQLYDLGKLHGVEELKSLRVEHAVLSAQFDKLAGERDDLREQVALLGRSSQIDQQAAQDVKSDLGRLEDELQAAREEIAFYQGIVSPGDVKPGLRIHHFSLEPGTEPGEYRYELVLTQLKHNDRYVSGVVDWKLHGIILGEPGELSLAGVTSPQTKQLKFRFRYFQELTGVVTLPDDFEAQEVELSIKPSGKNQPKAVVQVFDWSVPEQ